MKSDFLDFIGNARKRRNEKFRNQLSIFVVCLILSIFIWSLVRLSKDYYYAVDFRLSYTNAPPHMELREFSDSTIRIRFRIQGFEYFSEQLFRQRDHKYEVSLRDVRLKIYGDHPRGYLITSQVGKEIMSQTNFPVDFYSVSPDTLFFNFERNPADGLTPGSPGESVKPGQNVDSLTIRVDSTAAHGEHANPPTDNNR